jgi:hypothetical protein
MVVHGTQNIQPSDVTCQMVAVRGIPVWECDIWIRRTDFTKVWYKMTTLHEDSYLFLPAIQTIMYMCVCVCVHACIFV